MFAFFGKISRNFGGNFGRNMEISTGNSNKKMK